jgi:capsular polysaccharide biosynthesis protein
MDLKQNNVQNFENEISLKDLFFVLWKQKILIICITIIVAILAGLFSMYAIAPVYHSKLDIVISMPEVFNTRFGEYTLPITTNQQYINLITSNNVLMNTMNDMGYTSEGASLEDLKARISIGATNTVNDSEQNSFEVTISANNSQEALKLAEALYDNYIEFLDVMTKERAVTFYYDKFSVDIKTLKVSLESEREKLKKNEQLLTETPQTINQKDAMNELQDTTDFVILENIINPNYTKIENDIILNKQLIFSEEDSMRVYTNYLEELDLEKKAISKYYEADNKLKLESSVLSIIDTSVYLPSPPVAPTRKTSPSNLKNAIIGAILGGMLGVTISLVKNYWMKKE